MGIPKQMNSGVLDFIPLKRAGNPTEAASAILFLVSPLASYVTGHTLEVTGGVGI